MVSHFLSARFNNLSNLLSIAGEELQSVIKYYNTLIYQSEQQSDDELNQEYYAALHNKCDEFMQQIIDSRSQVSNTLVFNRDAITDSPNTLEDKIRND
jgi:hypothetical protein